MRTLVRAMRRLAHGIQREMFFSLFEVLDEQRTRERVVAAQDDRTLVLDGDEIETRKRIERRWADALAAREKPALRRVR